MSDIPIIDIHTHTFASADRGFAWQRGIARRTGEPTLNGTIPELTGLMEQLNIVHVTMLMYTPTRFMYEARLRGQTLPDDPAEREKIETEVKALMVQRLIDNNEWAIEVCKTDSRFSFMAGLDPVYMTADAMVSELDDKVKRGAKGGKIVLNALAVEADDPRLWPAYQRLHELELPIVSQAWRGDFYAQNDKIMTQFPQMRMNIAHLAHGHDDELVRLCQKHENFSADVSSRLHEIDDPEGHLTLESLADLIRRCGAEHILFGTNYPLNDPILYARVMREIPISDREKELVANGNAKRILKL